MNPAQRLHALGQSLWLDNITRTMVADGTLTRYIDSLAVTGLTSNPTIFEQAIAKGSAYDTAIKTKAATGIAHEALFFDLAIEDLSAAAAQLFRPEFERTNGVSTVGCRWKFQPAARRRHGRHRAGRDRAACQGGAAEPLHQDSRHACGTARPSKTRSLLACRSTSRCCSPPISTPLRPRPGCAASNGGWRRGSTAMCRRWPRCSSAAGTAR